MQTSGGSGQCRIIAIGQSVQIEEKWMGGRASASSGRRRIGSQAGHCNGWRRLGSQRRKLSVLVEDLLQVPLVKATAGIFILPLLRLLLLLLLLIVTAYQRR